MQPKLRRRYSLLVSVSCIPRRNHRGRPGDRWMKLDMPIVSVSSQVGETDGGGGTFDLETRSGGVLQPAVSLSE